jgi:hypothetical protein
MQGVVVTATTAIDLYRHALDLLAELDSQEYRFRTAARRASARLDALAERLEAVGREIPGEGGPGAGAGPGDVP